MASFQYGDICYPSEVDAMNAFVAKFNSSLIPDASNAYFWNLVNYAVDPSGTITLSLMRSDSTVYIADQVFNLMPCDEISSVSVFDKMPVQDMIFAAAFVIVFVIGIFQGHKS